MSEGEGGSKRSDGQATIQVVEVEKSKGSARQSGAKRDLTEGSIPKNLWTLSWPQTVEGALNVADQFADIFWAGRLGASSIAGLGAAQNYAQLAMTGRMGFDMAMRAMIARAVGAGNIALANHVAFQAFTLSGAFSVLMVILGVFLTEPMMRLIGVSDDVIAAGADYMRFRFIGQGAVAFRMMTGAALQASGDAVTPMKATAVSRVVHFVLSPCLIFGWVFLPELGLKGAALAEALGQLLGVGMNFHALFTGKSRLRLSLVGYRVDFPLLWRIIKLGAPASATTAERTIAQLVLFGLVARFGTFAVAAYTLTRQLEMLTVFTAMGVGQASGIIAGQNLGAGKPERAKATVNWALGIATAIHIVFALTIFVFAASIASLFNSQPEFVGPAETWIRIQTLAFALMGSNGVLMQTFNIVGDTVFPMIVTFVSLWGVQVPLALLLPDWWELGQFGIGWSTSIAIFVRTIAYGVYFVWGPWMKKDPLAVRKATASPSARH